MGFLSPSTEELADSVMRKRESGEATTIPVAIRKAIVGRGITAAADLKRRTREVAVELQRRSTAKKLAKKQAFELARKISP